MNKSKGKSRIFEVSGESNKNGEHAGFLFRQDFIPLKDGLEFIRESIEKSDCEYFEVRIYDSPAAAMAANEHRKKHRDKSLLTRAARYIRISRLNRLWGKNIILGEKLIARDGPDSLKKFNHYFNNTEWLDSVSAQKEFIKTLKAALREKKND